MSLVPDLVKKATYVAAIDRGLFEQANQAALIVARAARWDTESVNPFGENNEKWTDLIDGQSPEFAHVSADHLEDDDED